MIRLFKIFLCVILPFCLFSCNEGMNSIFYNVVNDNLINDSDLSNTIWVYGMVRLGTTYYIAAGKIHYRDVASSSWSSFTITSGIHNNIATDGTNLYIGVAYGDGTGGLFCYNPALPPSPTNPQSVDIGGSTAKYAVLVKDFGGDVYVSVAYNDGTYSLRSIDGLGGLTSTEVAWTAGLPDCISDFTVGGSITIVSGHHVYNGSITDIAPNSGYTYTGVFYFPDDALLYLSTYNGALYQSQNPNPSAVQWNAFTGYKKSNTDYDVHFTKFAGVTSAPDSRIFVGTCGTGFYIINPDPADFSISRFGETTAADLYNGAVESFLIDTTLPIPGNEPLVFCCTAGAGLWRNTFLLSTTHSWQGTWDRE
jgi:hypothetical protein